MGSQAAAAAARGGTDGGPQPAPCVPERLRQCLQGSARSARAYPGGPPEAVSSKLDVSGGAAIHLGSSAGGGGGEMAATRADGGGDVSAEPGGVFS